MDQGSQDAGQYRWTFAQAEFDETRWELLVSGHPVELERKPLELLKQLLRHAGEVLTKDELLESVWTGRIVVEAALTNAIGKLRKALGDDAQTLISTVSRVGYRLTGTVSRKVAQTLPPASVLAAGDGVPRRPNYRLVDRLARNEDSEVWRAEQPKTHEVRVFKFSLDGARLSSLKREVTLSRLLRDALGEREEFVRVVDWDFEEAPYFIESEFGGISLDTWFDHQGATADRSQRLALVAETADAVASAHEVGVLHKDIKPANLLVYGGPGNWHPRLTDFGSGRVLDAGRLEALGITQMGLTRTQSLSSESNTGTPLYLAPEVVAGQSPSIKSDLYALGVMLYQLLAGDFRRPLSPGWESDIDDLLLRRDIADFANGDPAKRPASARDLAVRLRTLDARRVQLDLEQAVQARIAANERRLALTRARRPWIAAAMLLLTAGMAGSLFYAHRAQQANAQAQTSAAQAQHERLRADDVNAFLVQDVIGAADPFRSGARELSLQEALDRAEKNIAIRFKGQPETQARVRIMLAQAYSGHSEHALARDQYAKAIAVIEATPSVDQSLALQARLHEAGSLLNLGDLAGFDRVMAPVLKAVDANPALEPKLRVFANFVAGQKAMLTGDALSAVVYLEKANAILATMPAPDPVIALRVKSILGMVYSQAGRQAQAVAMLREASGRAIRMYGPAHPETLNARILLGMALNAQHSFREAVQELTAVKRDAIATDGADSEPVLDVDELLAAALVGAGDQRNGVPLFESAYARRLKRAGASNPQTLDLAASTADALRLAGRGADALALVGKAQDAAASVPALARASVLQRLRFVQACAFAGSGDLASAGKVAGAIDANLMNTADPSGHWSQRVAKLRRDITTAIPNTHNAEFCPP